MKQRIIAILLICVLLATLAACGTGKETTLTGMVVSVDGTKISLVEMDADSMSGMDFPGSNNPQMPEGMEGFGGFGGFGNFDPNDFEGSMPERGEWGNGEIPEDFTMPEGFDMPEDFTMPEDGMSGFGGGMPNFGGGMPNFGGGQMPNFGGSGDGSSAFDNMIGDMETQEVDIADAHISVEFDGGKASGSMNDIQAGTFVTITMNGKGKATYVLVSSGAVFGGGRRPVK